MQDIFGQYAMSQIEAPLAYFNLAEYHINLAAKFKEIVDRLEVLDTQNTYLKTVVEKLKVKAQKKGCSKKKKHRRRRSLDAIQKSFKCSFPFCGKDYASDLALNLHVKNKHNGGTKTLREKLAKEIVLAEEKGEALPEINITFPPGYLKEFKRHFFNEQTLD